MEEPLPLVEAPYLPPLGPEKAAVLTLVMDLDETLVHYFETEDEGHVLVRPGTEEFLRELAEHYEIVVFTAALQDYADWVLDQIDPKKFIQHRLYRQHALPYGTSFVKDLSRLGRELNRVIIVDNVADNFQLQPENGILIKTWTDDPNDTALQELAPLLKSECELAIYICGRRGSRGDNRCPGGPWSAEQPDGGAGWPQLSEFFLCE